MAKYNVSLPQKAIAIENELLSSGARIQVDFDPKTGELKIYEVPRMKTKYRVVIAAG